MKEQEPLISLLKSGQKQAIQEFYLEHRQGFELFSRKYSKDGDLIRSIYQDTVLILIENAQKGKLDGLKSSLKTYLYAIGKNLVLQSLRQNGRYEVWDEANLEGLVWEEEAETDQELIGLLRSQFQKLGQKCQEVLGLFYYRDKSLEEIQQLLGYESKDVVKSQKSRCLKQLKDSLNKP